MITVDPKLASMVPGVWKSVTVAMYPSPLSTAGGYGQTGILKIWIDKGLAFVPSAADQSLANPTDYAFSWGYAPTNLDTAGNCKSVPCVLRTASTRVGIYRNDVDEVAPFVAYEIDDVKLTTTPDAMAGI